MAEKGGSRASATSGKKNDVVPVEMQKHHSIVGEVGGKESQGEEGKEEGMDKAMIVIVHIEALLKHCEWIAWDLGNLQTKHPIHSIGMDGEDQQPPLP